MTDSRSAALPPRLEGRALLAVRAAWLGAVLVTIGLVAAGFGRAFTDPQQIALPPLIELFEALGLNFRLMIALALLAPFTTVVGICGVVFWRRSSDPMALLFTLTLLVLYAFASRTLLTYGDHPVLRHSVSVFFAVAMGCLALILSLFPDGHWTPRWSRWLPVLAAALVATVPDGGRLLMGLLDGDIPVSGPVTTLVVGSFGVFLLGILAQIHRYRGGSGAIERQQTKWVVLPLAVLLILFLVIMLLPLLLPERHHRWTGMLLFVAVPVGILFPVAVANALLRHRLYEIDRAISRTVSYATITVVLAAVYVAGVAGLGTVVRAATGGGGGDLVVAASTLAVAALFQPLRRRVKARVDRRFDRARYDAQRTVEQFTQRLRAEVDLDALRTDLVQVTSAAIRPAHASLWLRAPKARS